MLNSKFTKLPTCFSKGDSWALRELGAIYMLASAGQPSLHGYDACMVFWTKGALRRNCRHKQCKTSFSPFFGFSVESLFT